MSGILMAAGRWGGIAALIALLIVLVKQLIAFIGFLMFAIKIAIVLAFIALMLVVVITMMRTRGSVRLFPPRRRLHSPAPCVSFQPLVQRQSVTRL